MAGRRTVLVLGGGVGGLVAARRLRRLLPRRDRVVLVEREPDFVFAPSLAWVAVGARRPAAIRRPVAALAARGVEVVRGAVGRLDAAARSAVVEGRELTGDAVVVALGADLAPEAVPGLAAAGCNVYTANGAAAARAALDAFTGGRIVVLTASPAYKCPAAPYEVAMLVEAQLRRRGLRGRAQVDLYAAEAAPMPVAGPAVSEAVRQALASKGIGYHPEHQVTAVDAEARRLSFANGATAGFDLLLFVPPHRAPPVLTQAGLTGPSGWVAVDRRSMATTFTGVYAVGDATSIPLAMGKPLPKAGVFARAQAEVAAHNVAARWSGGAGAAFDGVGSCFIEMGDGRAGYGAGDFYAEPTPRVALRGPSRWWHLGRVVLERQWLSGWYGWI
jgi:sulfide:quinone oxidoreductase